LEASKEGDGLYRKFGYEEIGRIEFDTRPFGGDHVDIHTVLVRMPPGGLKNEPTDVQNTSG